MKNLKQIPQESSPTWHELRERAEKLYTETHRLLLDYQAGKEKRQRIKCEIEANQKKIDELLEELNDE